LAFGTDFNNYIMEYPTINEVKAASRYTICRWYRFLPPAETEDQVQVENLISERLKELGGFTPEISKSLGWNEK